MANKTSIEWTDYNWNFLRGCSRVSEGCRNCYAEGVAARFSGEGMPYEGLAKFVDHKPRWTGEISFHEDILQLPLRWTKPRKVFVNSMSDLFHEKVTDEMLDKAFAVMALTPQHTYQILTKRPERIKAYFDYYHVSRDHNRADYIADQIAVFCGRKGTKGSDRTTRGDGIDLMAHWPLPNVWLGVSVEDQKTADERIPYLLASPAAVRWLSCEPLLGPINLRNVYDQYRRFGGELDVLRGIVKGQCHTTGRVDWVVVGGESGPNARPMNVGWLRSIVDQCKAASVPVFVKQLGSKPETFTNHGRVLNAVALKSKKGGDMGEWPEDLRVREYPGRSMEASA